MLILAWSLKVGDGSIQIEWREELSISMEKVARMKISLRQAAEGVLFAAMGGCGAFLFALMSTREPDKDLVTAVGLTGFVAGIACILSEIYTVTKELKRRRTQSRLQHPGRVSEVVLVEASSWWFVAACFVVSLSHFIVCCVDAIALTDSQVGYIMLPISLTCVSMGSGLRPKDEGAGLKILHVHFYILCIGSSIACAVGHFRSLKFSKGWAALAKIPFWIMIYQQALKLRRKAAQRTLAELSDFICHTLLLGGVGAMVPMIFFLFEAVSCMASGDGVADTQCENSTYAAMFLSVYAVVVFIVTVASNTVPREFRGEGVTFANLAIFRLKIKEKVQGALGEKRGQEGAKTRVGRE